MFNTGDRVTLDNLNPDDTDTVGTVRQVGTSENMPAPDEGMLLVSWGRSNLRWEYAEDLQEVTR